MEYADFDFNEPHNYSSDYHESGMSQILNNYSYNFCNQDVEVLTSQTFHSDSVFMSWDSIFGVDNLDFNESKPALITPAFLISTIETSKLNKIELSNIENETFIFLRFEKQNRNENIIPHLINTILDNPGVAISKCENLNFKSIYENVLFYKYNFSENVDNLEIKKYQSELYKVIQETTDNQSSLILKELMEWITTTTIEQNNDLTEKLNEIKHTDDVQMKLKLSIPLIKLLGIDFETEFDVKSWAKNMYSKYKFKIFKFI